MAYRGNFNGPPRGNFNNGPRGNFNRGNFNASRGGHFASRGGGQGRPPLSWQSLHGRPQADTLPIEQCLSATFPSKKVDLRVNSFPLSLPKDQEVYQYELKFWAVHNGKEGKQRTLDLSIISEDEAATGDRRLLDTNIRAHDRRQCISSLYNALFKEHERFFEADLREGENHKHVYAYDRSSIFFSTAKMENRLETKDVHTPLEITMANLVSDVIGQLHRPIRVYATLQRTGLIEFGNPNYELVERYLDILFCQHQLDSTAHIKLGTSMYNLEDPECVYLGSCTLLNGHQKCARQVIDAEKNVSSMELLLDAKISPFYTAIDLLEFVFEKFGHGPNDNWMQDKVLDDLQKLKGIYVRTKHRKNNEVFQIHDIERSYDARAMTFDRADGTPQTIADYFLKTYQRNLDFPHFPLVVKYGGRRDGVKQYEYYPLEVLRVQQGQKLPKTKMSKDQESAMIKASQRMPQDLVHRIFFEKERAGLTGNNNYLQSAKVQVANGLQTLPGQVLQAPVIVFATTHKVISFAEWDVKQDKFVVPAEYKMVAVFYLGVQEQQAKSFASLAFGRANELGMIIRHFDFAQLIKQELHIDMLVERIKYLRDNHHVDYCFFLGDAPGFHDLIKATEPQTGVPTQQLMPKTVLTAVEKRQMNTIANILLKMNLKRGGINQYFQQQLLSDIGGRQLDILKSFLKGTMVMGLDFSYIVKPKNGMEADGKPRQVDNDRYPPVLGYAFSLSDYGNVERGGFIYIQPNEMVQGELSENALSRPLESALARYKKTNGAYPQRILIYRTGVSAGQKDDFCRNECKSMGMILNKIYEKDAVMPHVIVVACQRAHNSRLFKHDNEINPQDRAPQQNVTPGTCIDGYDAVETIMVPHRALQGTAKPTIFKTFYDTCEGTPDAVPKTILDNVSHALCYMHEIVPSAISVPAHLRSAEQTASRGRRLWISNNNQTVDYEAAAEQLNPKIDTRYWA